MDYFVCHWIVITLAGAVVVDVLHISDRSVLFVVTVMSCVVILPLLSRVLSRPRFDLIMGRLSR